MCDRHGDGVKEARTQNVRVGCTLLLMAPKKKYDGVCLFCISKHPGDAWSHWAPVLLMRLAKISHRIHG